MNLTVDHDLSLISLILSASWVVQGVMLLLVVASIASWWVIFSKYMILRKERRLTERFEREFYDAVEQDAHEALYAKTQERKNVACIEELFRRGHRAHMRLASAMNPGANEEASVMQVLEGTRRAMQAAYQRELDQLEAHLPFLATVGSVSPYVGLFGTVWGIMNAFRGLADVSQATLAQVAPGIAEALIATAIGLFAAIPAVIAYNRFSHDIDRLANSLQVFMEEYLILVQRGRIRQIPRA
ncbi:MAG: protein TolQ [Thiobacillaceae bacterium]